MDGGDAFSDEEIGQRQNRDEPPCVAYNLKRVIRIVGAKASQRYGNQLDLFVRGSLRPLSTRKKTIYGIVEVPPPTHCEQPFVHSRQMQPRGYPHPRLLESTTRFIFLHSLGGKVAEQFEARRTYNNKASNKLSNSA
jgi:hypothetical protein